MSDQPTAPSDVPDEEDLATFAGFLENPDDPESNAQEVVDGVEDVPQDPNWKPEDAR